jgi:hypothetical protein
MGNVWEWNEALFYGSRRSIRGGSFYFTGYELSSSSRYTKYPYYEDSNIGFRVASVPEPATLLLLGLGALWNLKKIPRTKSRKFFEFHGAAMVIRRR